MKQIRAVLPNPLRTLLVAGVVMTCATSGPATGQTVGLFAPYAWTVTIKDCGPHYDVCAHSASRKPTDSQHKHPVLNVNRKDTIRFVAIGQDAWVYFPGFSPLIDPTASDPAQRNPRKVHVWVGDDPRNKVYTIIETAKGPSWSWERFGYVVQADADWSLPEATKHDRRVGLVANPPAPPWHDDEVQSEDKTRTIKLRPDQIGPVIDGEG